MIPSFQTIRHAPSPQPPRSPRIRHAPTPRPRRREPPAKCPSAHHIAHTTYLPPREALRDAAHQNVSRETFHAIGRSPPGPHFASAHAGVSRETPDAAGRLCPLAGALRVRIARRKPCAPAHVARQPAPSPAPRAPAGCLLLWSAAPRIASLIFPGFLHMRCGQRPTSRFRPLQRDASAPPGPRRLRPRPRRSARAGNHARTRPRGRARARPAAPTPPRRRRARS